MNMKSILKYALPAFALFVIVLNVRNCHSLKELYNTYDVRDSLQVERIRIGDSMRLVDHLIYQRDSTVMQARIDSLAAASQAQAAVVKRYLRTALADRAKAVQVDTAARMLLIDYDSAVASRDTLIGTQVAQITALEDARRADADYYAVEVRALEEQVNTLGAFWREAAAERDQAQVKVQLEKRKRFGVGVHAGYGASQQGLTPVISVGINYNIFKF